LKLYSAVNFTDLHSNLLDHQFWASYRKYLYCRSQVGN